MKDNILDLDAESLFSLADIIDGYCAKQREIINVYYAQIMALESEWRDDETFGGIANEVVKLRTELTKVLDEIYYTYPKYFRQKAQSILERPVFNSGEASEIRVVEEIRVPRTDAIFIPTPVSNSSCDYVDFGKINTAKTTVNSTNTSSKHITDNEYIKTTFNVEGVSNQLMSKLQTSFAAAPQILMQGVYNTTNHLAFTKSHNGSFYAPCGIDNQSLKSVIAVDYNSSTCDKDIISLVGQHVFYWSNDNNYYAMLDALAVEGNNELYKEDKEYVKYLQTFKEGVFVPENQSDKRLYTKKYSTASRFFVECFEAYVNKDTKKIEELKKFFPESFNIFLSIIKNEDENITV